jgi:hypothetical protein
VWPRERARGGQEDNAAGPLVRKIMRGENRNQDRYK